VLCLGETREVGKLRCWFVAPLLDAALRPGVMNVERMAPMLCLARGTA
jgi:hypothetical protein